MKIWKGLLAQGRETGLE